MCRCPQCITWFQTLLLLAIFVLHWLCNHKNNTSPNISLKSAASAAFSLPRWHHILLFFVDLMDPAWHAMLSNTMWHMIGYGLVDAVVDKNIQCGRAVRSTARSSLTSLRHGTTGEKHRVQGGHRHTRCFTHLLGMSRRRPGGSRHCPVWFAFSHRSASGKLCQCNINGLWAFLHHLPGITCRSSSSCKTLLLSVNLKLL